MASESEILSRVMKVLPTLTAAVQSILASDSAHTVETAVAELCSHNTPGQPDSPALSAAEPTKPPAKP